MKDPLISFEQRENYLLITGHGERNDFISIVDSTKNIHDVVMGLENKYVLLDYSQVKFNIPQTNVFDIVRIYETKMPDLKQVVAAVVVSQLNSEIGVYWKTIAQQRGFNFRVFNNYSNAEKWLAEKKNSAQANR